jgi:hypothetical protein
MLVSLTLIPTHNLPAVVFFSKFEVGWFLYFVLDFNCNQLGEWVEGGLGHRSGTRTKNIF